jgi:hypothetical protein
VAGERDDGGDDGGVLPGDRVGGTGDAGEVAGLEVDAAADVDATADVDGLDEVVAGEVPVGPVALPWVADAQPASPSATATKPIPMWTRLVVMTRLASP